MKYVNTLKQNLAELDKAKNQLLTDLSQLENFNKAVDCVVKAYQSGGRLYIAGNGGSAADAQHLAAEFVSKLARDRNPLPAEALTTDSSILTAIGNDYGYEQVFARQLEGKLTANDVFLGISTSGQSKNILKAFDVCKRKGVKSIAFTGHGGRDARAVADFCVSVPGAMTSTIQELHIVLSHTLCEAVESELFPI
jgi:D-sedoheptulose 7-phosphate isomerase